MIMRRLFFVLAIFGLMLTMGSSARADSISFNLSTIANDGSGGPLHGGTVLSPYLILVTVTMNVANGSATLISGTNVNCPDGASTCEQVEFAPDTAAGSTLTDVPDPVYINISGTYAVSGNDGIPSGGPGGSDEFGTLSVGSGAAKPAEVYFWLVPIGTNSWASAANVLTPTANGGTTL